MSTLNDWFKEQFKPNPEILGMLEKAKKQEYNKKEEKKFDASINAAAALAINGAENAAKAAGIDTSKNNNNSAGISAIASLAKSGVETAAKGLTSATKKTNTTSQKPKEVTKTDAEKMMDYLYDEKNLPKTENFLFNNGFPSREDREYNKEFFGEQKEKKQTVDLFKAKTNSILNPSLPNKNDRLFLKGLMGDEEEESDYNKQVADNKKAKSDYAFAFRGSPFEKLFAEPQNPPAGMPLKKQDPIEAILGKAKQHGKLSAGTLFSDSIGTASDIVDVPGAVFDAAKELWETSKEKVDEIWETSKNTAKDFLKNPKDTAMNLVNDASSWANKKGFLDDATNAFFLTSDILQDFPIKRFKTDSAHKAIAIANYIVNQKIDLSKYEADGGYINDQSDADSPASKIRYGNGTLYDNGCEIIAVNNALVSLGDKKDIRKIAKDFETNGQTLFGAFGTSPFAIGDYFRKHGYKVESFIGDKKIYNLDIPDSDTYIISFWNSDKVLDMIHTVSVDKLPDGKYKIYNMGRNRTVEIDSLNEYFLKSNRVPLVLHCIKKG